jgi:GcrA cell cycle regulator
VREPLKWRLDTLRLHQACSAGLPGFQIDRAGVTEADMSWNDERVELLKKLWNDGLSASQIAGELGGVTRNAVIGKVHRLGLSGRTKAQASAASAPRARKPVPTVAARPAAARSMQAPQVRGNVVLAAQPVMETMIEYVPEARAEVVVPMSRRVHIMELREGMCKWPIGDPMQADFVYCGADCTFGTPYCTHHSAVAYQPSIERRRAR